MPNNFRLTGKYYVSPAGNDAWDGLTKDTPKQSINAIVNAIGTDTGQTIVVGAGMYEGAINKTASGGNNFQFLADGLVKLRGNGSNAANINLNNTPYRNIIFENFGSVAMSGGAPENCIFINCKNISQTTRACLNTIYIDCTFTSNYNSANAYYGCIFINTPVYARNLRDSYLNGTSTLHLESGGIYPGYSNDNIMGEIYDHTTGSSAGVYYSKIADAMAAQPTFNVNGLVDPQTGRGPDAMFNNPAKYDFTLKANSPHINAAVDGVSNIGGTPYAAASDMALDAAWTAAGGAVVSKADKVNDDLILSGSDWILAPGKNWGQITSGPIFVSSNPQVAGVVNYNGQKLFNRLAGQGAATNNNVSDANVYSLNDASGAGNPDRPSYEMCWTDMGNMPSVPTIDSEWNNNATGIMPAGAFTRFEIDRVPQFDSSGKGNGEPDFNPSVVYTPNFTYVRIRLTLSNPAA